MPHRKSLEMRTRVAVLLMIPCSSLTRPTSTVTLVKSNIILGASGGFVVESMTLHLDGYVLSWGFKPGLRSRRSCLSPHFRAVALVAEVSVQSTYCKRTSNHFSASVWIYVLHFVPIFFMLWPSSISLIFLKSLSPFYLTTKDIIVFLTVICGVCQHSFIYFQQHFRWTHKLIWLLDICDRDIKRFQSDFSMEIVTLFKENCTQI